MKIEDILSGIRHVYNGDIVVFTCRLWFSPAEGLQRWRGQALTHSRRAGRVRARTDVYPEPYHSHKTQSDTVRAQSDTVARAASGLSVCGCLRPSCGADDELVSLTCRITLGLSVLEFTESRYKRYRFDTLYHYLIRVPVGQPWWSLPQQMTRMKRLSSCSDGGVCASVCGGKYWPQLTTGDVWQRLLLPSMVAKALLSRSIALSSSLTSPHQAPSPPSTSPSSSSSSSSSP